MPARPARVKRLEVDVHGVRVNQQDGGARRQAATAPRGVPAPSGPGAPGISALAVEEQEAITPTATAGPRGGPRSREDSAAGEIQPARETKRKRHPDRPGRTRPTTPRSRDSPERCPLLGVRQTRRGWPASSPRARARCPARPCQRVDHQPTRAAASTQSPRGRVIRRPPGKACAPWRSRAPGRPAGRHRTGVHLERTARHFHFRRRRARRYSGGRARCPPARRAAPQRLGPDTTCTGSPVRAPTGNRTGHSTRRGMRTRSAPPARPAACSPPDEVATKRVRGVSYSSRAVPSCSSRPWLSTRTRSASANASSCSWVTNTVVTPARSSAERSSRRVRSRSDGSRLESGSSSSSTRGLGARARATATAAAAARELAHRAGSKPRGPHREHFRHAPPPVVRRPAAQPKPTFSPTSRWGNSA